MRAQPGVGPFFRIAALLLGTALVWPTCAPARELKRHATAAANDDGFPAGEGIALPDLPPAEVTITPSDLAPGDGARRALSRIVADPGAVLKAYAPLRGGQDLAPQPSAGPPAATAPSSGDHPATGQAGSAATAAKPLQAPGAPMAERPGPATISDPPEAAAHAAAAVAELGGAQASAILGGGPQQPKQGSAAASGSSAPRPDQQAESAQPDPARKAMQGSKLDSSPVPDTGLKPAESPNLPGGQKPDSDLGTASDPTPSPSSAEPAAPAEAAQLQGSGEQAPGKLDPAVLQKALASFVGSEPAPGAERDPAEVRYKDRAAISAVYAARNFAPFWIEDGKFNAKARAALARVDHAAEDGLDLRAFPVSVPRGGNDEALAAAELCLTEAVVAYGKQASGGRIDPSRLAPLIGAKPDVADAARVLTSLDGAQDAGEALRAFNPPQKGYAQLRDKLAELRQNSDMAGRSPIPYGPTLRPGMKDARVPLIRARFGLDLPSDEADRENLVYDTQVAAAVAQFQRAHHLPASGILTIRTIAALSGGNPRRLEDEILANMERWRWLPRDMGENHIEVNIPDYSLRLMHGDAVSERARVVVGQPDKPTPVFSDTMRFIIVNPYWNVPLSIVKKEMLPKLAADPDYFANHGYEVVERNGVTYVRQPPGDSNALGRIKFMFPNKYSVYLHDTNARALFGQERRALSHGCVRVEQPFRLAEAVLGRDHGWTESRIKKMVGGDERTINLPTPLPLHIVYFTAFVDDTGALRLRDDVYGYSAKVKAALGLES